jgi:hypothetical protein
MVMKMRGEHRTGSGEPVIFLPFSRILSRGAVGSRFEIYSVTDDFRKLPVFSGSHKRGRLYLFFFEEEGITRQEVV